MTMSILAIILIGTWRSFVELVVVFAFVPTMTVLALEAF
jgi:hypothetical protein